MIQDHTLGLCTSPHQRIGFSHSKQKYPSTQLPQFTPLLLSLYLQLPSLISANFTRVPHD